MTFNQQSILSSQFAYFNKRGLFNKILKDSKQSVDYFTVVLLSVDYN